MNAVVQLAYLAAAVCFVTGLHLMNSPPTARFGNRVSAAGMAVAVAATLVLVVRDGGPSGAGWLTLAIGVLAGSVAGVHSGRRTPTTAMPQLVSLFNAVGGGAAVLVGAHDLLDSPGVAVRVPAVLDVLIGGVTFSGSLIAAGKLHGVVPGRPIRLPGGSVPVFLLAAAGLGVGGAVAADRYTAWVLLALAGLALAIGVLGVLPIGGADMPVVVSLLNACTGTAVALVGFVLDNTVLVVAGALVGASGGILTKLMADAMNRSIPDIVLGGYGTGDGTTPQVTGAAAVRAIEADDAAILLAYARKVMIVPGYGLAAAQAQHAARELADLLAGRGIEVGYAIHPVAGRMPGHMNVLLAEANVPYEQMRDLDQANAELPRADVALVVGANDVVNPAARRPGNPVSGMPILDVDRAAHVIVIKRSMGSGYAGIDNELFTDPRTAMLFADARAGLGRLTAAVKVLVG
ncbi:NAD(P) transhydrogenase subunit beta [Virgisporangium aliadipatigenens]|uniref:NAD(P) transhydrogenase subunit beta n=1 Tax=Virgisporangium aliadipatigenens TaxID=741659 RepID=A0A8J4DSP3_9ACTN|nr:NAD(P)(+) transhydrogenase (Re/Si-specific) subunit beta [Virgisporangium aliadipatigenens]GIJ48088.1 NAD(P) transhydrogenase subunit beta [Virgisporangium aliadipatigenens]